MTTAAFTAIGNTIALVRETPSRLPFGKPSREEIAVADWSLHRPPAATAALARILQVQEDGEVSRDGAALVVADAATVALHPAFIARLSDSEAQALGLPLATRLSLNLRSSGLIHQSFRIDAQWTGKGGASVRVTQGTGRLRHDGRDWRIPERLYSTLHEIDAVNAATDEAARHAALAGLKRVIGADAAAAITTDGIIDRLRLSYASGFSLALNPSAGGIDFDPVLFGHERLEAAGDGNVLDEEADSLLPPALASGFARRFRGGDGTRATYLLDDGSILYVDPQLQRALKEVRRAQSGTPDERRAFAAAPARYIAEALARDGDDTDRLAAAGLFVETQQFSARVAGIDIWRKPVLPWVKPKADSWLPEKFGLRIGEGDDARTIEIAPEDLGGLSERIADAVREARPHFQHEGEVIPATQATIKALEGLRELISMQPERIDSEAPSELRQRYFLQVRDNLEDVVYAPLAARAPAAEAPPTDLPASLRSPPKPHQVEGFRWLVRCWQAGLPGALLADDMGLGKTYQSLAFLAWMRAQEPQARPILIVAPTGLLSNWRAEIARHLEPDALGRVVGAYGRELTALRDGAGRDIDAGSATIDPAAWTHAGVVLTTYETMRDYHLSFARQPFAAILYDEAQKLKNPASQITRAAKTLNARFSLALTGTPVENRLQDLWSIFDVVHPGLLGSSKTFEETYTADPERLRVLRDKLTEPGAAGPPVLLRRMKDECLDSLPAKTVKPLPMPMPPRQVAAYDRVVARALAVKGTGQRGRMLEVLAQLRGVSLHPTAPGEALDDADYWGDSARLDTLFRLLGDVAAAREKVLIFCESLAMQALLAAEIRRRFALSHVVARIHGGVAGEARQAAVDAFQSRGDGFDAMILSPKAGGVGLTLTAANHVVHLSRWWNPAVEDQATDRAHRIGQQRPVTVYLPQAVHPDPALAETSFDLKLHALMERKRTLSRGLFAPGEDESDADALFEAVVTEAAPEPAPMPGVVVTPPAPPPRPRRILGLRSRPAPPPSVAPLPSPPAPSWPRRIVFEAGGTRDYTIFSAPIANDPVRQLIIIDPYGAAGAQARESVARFAKMLLAKDTGVEPVRLITFDASDVDVRQPESSDHQYADMQDRWTHAFGDRIDLQFLQQPKRSNRSLHDREVRAVTKSGRTLIWDLGRGIDGVMQNRHRCNVTLTEE